MACDPFHSVSCYAEPVLLQSASALHSLCSSLAAQCGTPQTWPTTPGSPLPPRCGRGCAAAAAERASLAALVAAPVPWHAQRHFAATLCIVPGEQAPRGTAFSGGCLEPQTWNVMESVLALNHKHEMGWKRKGREIGDHLVQGERYVEEYNEVSGEVRTNAQAAELLLHLLGMLAAAPGTATEPDSTQACEATHLQCRICATHSPICDAACPGSCSCTNIGGVIGAPLFRQASCGGWRLAFVFSSNGRQCASRRSRS